jgi:acetyl esterase/lipase
MPIEPQTFVYKTAGCDVRADVFVTERTLRKPRTLVHIHGGALIMGKRSRMPRTQLDRYLDAGFTVVSIDYRLAPETKLPGIIEDVQDAFRWVREKGPEIFRADPARIAVTGQSAGGYLTLMAGFCVEPRPAVSREAALMEVGKTPVSEGGENRDKFYLYCRQNGMWPKEVAGLDPVKQKDAFKPYCPIQNVTKDYPPTLLLHGDADTDVPYEQSAMMAGTLARAGVDSALITIEGGCHGFDCDEESADSKRALDIVMTFLREHLK